MHAPANPALLKPVEPPGTQAVLAAMIAGGCSFLGFYCTQPLLPLFQREFHATEVEVSLTVGVVTLTVAFMAPAVGLLAESIGRKRIIVPALFAMAFPLFMGATSTSLKTLIYWRVLQGLFVPGVLAVIMAYIHEEFAGRTGAVMSAYVAGTIFGGFSGRFLTGLIAARWDWPLAFVVLGCLNLLGAVAVLAWLPRSTHFVPGQPLLQSLTHTWAHVRNPRLLLVCGLGFTVLFSLVGVFTYANFYLARPPFSLTTAGLGSIFFVYLFGCLVTPLSGRFLDGHGFARTTWLSFGFCLTGLGLTLVHSLAAVIAGLAFYSTGLFIMQGAATVLTGVVAGRARSAAAGIYVTSYYLGGSVGTALPAWFWRQGGWPACIGLFAGTSVVVLCLGLAGGNTIPGRNRAKTVQA